MISIIKEKKRTKVALGALLWFVVLIAITLPMDQWTKSYARREFLLHEDALDSTIYQGQRQEQFFWQTGDSWLTLQMTYVRNHGVSWGLMRSIPEQFRVSVLLSLGALFASALGYAAIKFINDGHIWLGRSMLALLAGSAGNGLDRIRLGYVVDFLSLKSRLWGILLSLPAFNVADIVIVLSLFWVIVQVICEAPTHKKGP